MKLEQKSLRIGAAVIALATLLRLAASGFFTDITQFLIHPDVTSFLLFAGTGKVFISDSGTADASPETTAPVTQPAPDKIQAVFSPSDTELVPIKNYPGYDFDKNALLQKPLSWDLTIPEPTVLIIHSHACESFENTEGYTESAYYRTTDTRYNMVSVGALLAQCLREKGIGVIHDTTLHDYPSYNDSYPQSRITVENYLAQYPSICLVLDIHRDAYEDGNGNQASSTLMVDGKETSQLMIVAGTNANGTKHDHWQENLSTALKLQASLEKLYPGLCRPLCIRSSAFNQFLCPGALLIEVGTAGDTRQNALAAAELLADGIAALAYGSK